MTIIYPIFNPSYISGTQQYIKRPLNAYMLWTIDQRAKIGKDTGQKMNDVVRNLGQKWKELSDAEKKPYFDRQKQAAKDHKRALLENPNLAYAPPKKKSCPADKQPSIPATPEPAASPVSVTSTIPATSPVPNGYVYNQNGFPMSTASNSNIIYSQNGIPNTTRVSYIQNPSINSHSNIHIVPSTRQPQTPQQPQHQMTTVMYYDPNTNTYMTPQQSHQQQPTPYYQPQIQSARVMPQQPPQQQKPLYYPVTTNSTSLDDSKLTSAQICERYYASLSRPMYQNCFESPLNLRDPNYYYDLHIQLFNRPL